MTINPFTSSGTRKRVRVYYEHRFPNLVRTDASVWHAACPFCPSAEIEIQCQTGFWWCESCSRGGDLYALEAALQQDETFDAVLETDILIYSWMMDALLDAAESREREADAGTPLPRGA